jgi:CO/xanthine dehydrogenase Mo-binding subunit
MKSLNSLEPTDYGPTEKSAASRRDFLRSAGALIVGFSMAGSAKKMAAQNPINPSGLVDPSQVDSWISIGADESITAYSGKIEFGQGFSTVQTQLIAEELSVPLDRVIVIFGDTGFTPDQGVTSGSQSTRTEFGPGGLREAVDTARDVLYQLASQQLDVPVSQLTVRNGVFSVGGDLSFQMSYGQLLQGKPFNLTVNSKAVSKPPSEYVVLGTAVPRIDIPAKTTGQFHYVQHVRLAGMLQGGSGDGAIAKIWSATHGVYPLRDSVAMVLGIPKANVRVIFVEGSGCYGLSGNDSVTFDAALLSQAVGQPVRVQYTRKDEMTAGEPFGPAHVIRMNAGVDSGGQLIVWSQEGWSMMKGDRPNATTPGNILSGALAGFATPPVVPEPARLSVTITTRRQPT